MQDRSGVNDDLTVAVCYLPPEASSHGEVWRACCYRWRNKLRSTDLRGE